MTDDAKTFMVEDAELVYLNFTGRERQYNPAGFRNFGVIIEDDVAAQMAEDGWLVKEYRKDPEDEPRPFIPVAVRFDIRPPRIVLLTENTRTQLNEDTVDVLDFANIKSVDVIARAHNWGREGRGGIKAYLQTMFVTIEEDYLEKKYHINEDPPN